MGPDLHSDPNPVEESLRNSEERFRDLVELLSQPVTETDKTRKLTITNLKGLEACAYALFHSSPVATALARLENTVLADVNGAWEKATGVTRKEAIGRTPRELNFWVNPDDRDRLIERLRDKGLVRDFEFKARHKSGRVSDMLMSAELIELAGVKYVLSLTQNITERKRAEETLKERERHFRALIESGTDIITEFDVHGKAQYVSPSIEQTLGYRPDELIGKSAFHYVHPEDIDRVRDTFFAAVANPDHPYSLDFRFRHGDGSWRVIEAVGKFVLDSEGVTGVIVNSRDVTERRQGQKMEAIGVLAGGIAHDFNNILTAIMGYTQLALQDAEKNTPAYENLDGVLKASARAKDLVKHILTFSRQTERELQPVQVKLIVKETLKLLRSSLPATIEIRHDIHSEGIVWSDPTQIHQIMMNLCTNAAHAMSERGGILKVNLKDVELNADSPARHPEMKSGKYLLLEVTDTGHGISPSIRDRIFEPFFTTKDRGEGTGMGLAVVHGVVKKMGGFIAVDAEAGKGSSFKIYMPRMSQEAKPASESEPSLPRGEERILFVDDEPVLVDVGKQLLERLGYRVTSRTSSIEALKLFQARPDDFDLVITDLTMPKLSGDGIFKEIMKIRKDFPVILCTGFSTRFTEEKAKELGIRAFLMKPLVIAELAKTIRQVLDNHA